ncbi:MAG TPA: glycosyltransferase [Cryomorphaceae bacterium]|nr:glycosyltransferase [Cryomorphaceae bacterium]
MARQDHILFGVLNWGLGHATRSVPLIRALKDAGFKPVIASDGVALEYLQELFPELPTEELPAYGVRYSNGAFFLNMMMQLPRIGLAVYKERALAAKLLRKYDAKGMVSDNRLGFSNSSVPSAYITHQLNIPVSYPLVNTLHHRYINRFSECWVPDFEGENTIGGALTHTLKPEVPLKFIGALSQLEEQKEAQVEYDAVVILSGPEPQRSLLEKKLLNQLEQLKGNFLLVRGTLSKPDLKTKIPFKNLMVGEEIAQVINRSRLIISRSGYSSLMDYHVLRNKALLIPTPGMVEQEYLAESLMEKKLFYAVSQKKVSLAEDIPRALEYPGFHTNTGIAVDRTALFGLFKGERKS